MDVPERMELVRGLCSFEGRVAGSDAERRAGNWLAERLRGQGRRAEVEPTHVHPHWAVVHALHSLIALAGSLIALAAAPIGFALVFAAAVSMYLDLNGRLYLLRRLFFRRASQNVVSRGRRRDAPGRVVICAHYDAARTGFIYGRRWTRTARRIGDALRLPPGLFRPIFWSIALLLPVLGLRMAGIDDIWVSAVQLPPTVVLVVAIFLLVDIELSAVVPGANDNASGVATALSLAEELDREPPDHLDVWVVLTGGEECQQEGMRAFVRRHRDELDRDSTWFVNLCAVGGGDVRFESVAGWVVSVAMRGRLRELCEAVAAADREGPNRYRAEAVRYGQAADSMPPRLAGYEALTIACLDEDGLAPHYHRSSDLPENLDPAAFDRAHSFGLELVRALDRDVGRASERREAGAAVV